METKEPIITTPVVVYFEEIPTFLGETPAERIAKFIELKDKHGIILLTKQQ